MMMMMTTMSPTVKLSEFNEETFSISGILGFRALKRT